MDMTSPVEINSSGNGFDLEVISMELGEPDKRGKCNPVEITGSNKHMQFDTIVYSMGKMASMDGFKGGSLELPRPYFCDVVGQDLSNGLIKGDCFGG